MAKGTYQDKRSHFGMAGHYAAMSEFLLRGYNVAIPSVDVGDDVIVVDDREGTLWRVQVKTAESGDTTSDSARSGQKTVRYNLSRKQLKEQKASELLFIFMVRWEQRWRFILVPRDTLDEIRDQFVVADRTGKVGPKPKPDSEAKTDVLGLDIIWTADNATGWGASFKDYMDVWPAEFPDRSAVQSTVMRSAAPLPDPGTGSAQTPSADPPPDP